MTVANAISEQSWTTDGVTASFDFTYPVLAVTDLVVSLDGAAMTLGVDYTATLLSGGASGARIVFLSAPAAAKTLFMLRSPPVSQEVGFVAGQKIYEDTIGDLFDKLTMLVARLARRALLLDDKDPTTTPLVMPTKATRASGVLSFDSSGVAAITPLAQLYAMASVSTRFLGAWSGATAYVAGDAVSYNGSSYRALVDNTNVTPGTDASKWFVLASKGAAGRQARPARPSGRPAPPLSTLARSPALTLRASRSRTPARSSGPSTSPLSQSPQAPTIPPTSTLSKRSRYASAQ